MLYTFGSPLTLAQVHAALAYDYDHQEEIDASFSDEDELAAKHERKRVEYLNRRQ